MSEQALHIQFAGNAPFSPHEDNSTSPYLPFFSPLFLPRLIISSPPAPPDESKVKYKKGETCVCMRDCHTLKVYIYIYRLPAYTWGKAKGEKNVGKKKIIHVQVKKK